MVRHRRSYLDAGGGQDKLQSHLTLRNPQSYTIDVDSLA
jgi:hypothetical protein